MLFTTILALVLVSESENKVFNKYADKLMENVDLEELLDNINHQNIRIKYLEDKLVDLSGVVEELSRENEKVTRVMQDVALPQGLGESEAVVGDSEHFDTFSSMFLKDFQHKSSRHSHRVHIRSQNTQHTAFSAYLSRTVDHVASGQTINCDAVLINDGNAYNQDNGVFTATDTGVYIFSFAIASTTNTYVKLQVDGINTAGVLVSPPGGVNITTMASNTILLQIRAGQSVWLENHINNDGNLISYGPFIYTTFSGFRLY